jgi:hypothetical protein
MPPRAHAIIVATSLSAALGALSACTGLEPAAIGAGATAAESGVTFFSKGKARSFEPAVYGDVVAAVDRAAAALAFHRASDQRTDSRGRAVALDAPEQTRARLVFLDEHDESIVIVVERRTANITMLQSDVGVLGFTGLAATLTGRVQAELRVHGAYERVAPSPRASD